MSPQMPERQDIPSTAQPTVSLGVSAVSGDDFPPHGALRRLSWLWVLLAGVLAYLLLLRTLVVTQNPNFFPSLILLGSIVMPATVLTSATAGGRRGIQVGSGTVAFTAIVGGILGTVAAGTLEYDTLRALDAVPMIMVGLIEEGSKIVVPAAVLLINRRIGWPGAVVLGVSSGAGFATLETMGYGFAALLNGGLVALDGTLLLRALLAPAGHIAWTGLSMGAIGRIRGTSHPLPCRPCRRRCLRCCDLGRVVGCECELDHRIVVALLSFGALMLTLSAARRAENRRYAAQA